MKENISEIMQKAYIDYSMSVIVSRALPDVRDGFKPVQRSVFFTRCSEKDYYIIVPMINVQVL